MLFEVHNGIDTLQSLPVVTLCMWNDVEESTWLTRFWTADFVLLVSAIMVVSS